MSAIVLAGGRIELLELAGDPARPPLLLLHEGLGSVGLWREFPERLASATGARVVAFSRYGHGGSDPPPQPRSPRFMHEEAAEVVPELRDRLGLADPVLVGHSDGASIALLHAAEHPVRGVVAIAPHVFVEPVGLAEIRRAKAAYEGGELRERLARHHRDVDAAFYGWNDVWLHPDFRAWSIEDRLGRIGCPLLLIQGTEDQYGTMAQLDAIERRVAGPVRRVELPCRHAPALEAPDATLDAIAAFLAELSSAAKNS